MNRVLWKRIALLVLAAMMLLSFTACGMEQELAELGAAALEAALSESTTASPTPAASVTAKSTAPSTAPPAATTAPKPTEASTSAAAATAAATTTKATTTAATAAATTAAATTPAATTATTIAATTAATTTAVPAPAEDGYFYDLENVVRYLDKYGHLPDNFIKKDDAEALGWTGGSVQKYRDGAAIGGDRFGNREGILPKARGRTWTECDIDTDGARSRGAKRLVFSNDGLYFYTDDHYESFREVVISETGEVTFK